MNRRFDDPREAFAAAGLRLFERGWLSSNNVLFPGRGDDDAILIDSGYVAHQEQTLALVRHGLGDRPLRRILNTHLHSDHCGGNAALQSFYGCEAWVPEREFDKVRDWDPTRLTYDATGQQCPRFDVHGCLRPGDAIDRGGGLWEVVSSPGHDPESVVLYRRDLRLLLSADALWQNGFGVVFPELEGLDAFDALASTLDRLAALPIDWVIPGHGPAFGEVGAAIDRARRRLEGFRSSPASHAMHAAKVLVKFHLLEVRSERVERLRKWAEAVPYLVTMHRDHFAGEQFQDWLSTVFAALTRAGAARFNGDHLDDA